MPKHSDTARGGWGVGGWGNRETIQLISGWVNICPLMVKPCMLSDRLTGSAGAMLESNWVRVCELEERSLNVSHCCKETDGQ